MLFSELSIEDQFYHKHMTAWAKEMRARETQINTVIGTSLDIVRQNRLQLKWHLKSFGKAMLDHNEWMKAKGLTDVQLEKITKL